MNQKNLGSVSTNLPDSKLNKFEDEVYVKKLNVYSEKLGLSLNEIKQKNISKNQLKKMLKNKVWQKERIEKRKIQREKRKLKRQNLMKQLGSRLSPKKFNTLANSSNKLKVVIDLSFEPYMNERELQKTFKQVQRCYSINRRSSEPVQLYLTSVTGKIKEYLDTKKQGIEKWDVFISEKHWYDLFKSTNELSKITFLSSDSSKTLPDSSEIKNQRDNHIFIIGGLVDHNFHKNLTLNLAQEKNIPTAKLPLDKYLKMSMTKVLAINHVFELLLISSTGISWEDAFNKCVPNRKIQVKLTSKKKSKSIEKNTEGNVEGNVENNDNHTS